jgi:hypothetical protein
MITLQYKAPRNNLALSIQISTMANALVFPPGTGEDGADSSILAVFNMYPPFSDVTTSDATHVIRTVQLQQTPAFLSAFPSVDLQKAAVVGLYRLRLEATVCTTIESADPIIT